MLFVRYLGQFLIGLIFAALSVFAAFLMMPLFIPLLRQNPKILMVYDAEVV